MSDKKNVIATDIHNVYRFYDQEHRDFLDTETCSEMISILKLYEGRDTSLVNAMPFVLIGEDATGKPRMIAQSPTLNDLKLGEQRVSWFSLGRHIVCRPVRTVALLLLESVMVFR